MLGRVGEAAGGRPTTWRCSTWTASSTSARTPCPARPQHLARARELGVHLAFITNNASRPPEAVVEKLAGIGVEASVADVVTSAQAAARVLAERYGAGASVAVLGAARPRGGAAGGRARAGAVGDERAVAMVTGYGPDVVWRDVMRAAVRVRDGLPWVASNADLSLPTRVRAGARARRDGRPAGALHAASRRWWPASRSGRCWTRPSGGWAGEHPLMVGDRLDTDIEGAHEAEVDSLLVLTGVTGLADLVGGRAAAAADVPRRRPGRPVRAARRARRRDGDAWRSGGWRATVADGRLEVAGRGRRRTTGGARSRAAAWEHLDRTGEAATSTGWPRRARPRSERDGSLAP